jgi:hypothetical protein
MKASYAVLSAALCWDLSSLASDLSGQCLGLRRAVQAGVFATTALVSIPLVTDVGVTDGSTVTDVLQLLCVPPEAFANLSSVNPQADTPLGRFRA